MSTDYGVANLNLYDESSLFTKITEGMKQATKRETYQPYFQIQQGAVEQTYLGGLQTTSGTTKSGKTEGFAGSARQDDIISQMQDAYAREVMGVEEDITAKMGAGQDTIRSIAQANQSTSLQLKQLAEANDDGDDSTSFICAEIRKSGNMTKRESLKMMKFLVKSVILHPSDTYWYVTTAKFIINEANKIGFDWSQPYVKDMFVNNVLALEESNYHDKATAYYINSCLRLAEIIGLSVACPPPETTINKFKGWLNFIKRKATWSIGLPYLKNIIKYRSLICQQEQKV